MNLIPFLPSTECFILYYPETFTIEESEDNIVSIIPDDSESGDNVMTITSYSTDNNVEKEFLLRFLESYVKDYTEVECPIEIKNENGICFRGIYKKDDFNWIWIVKAFKTRIVLISIHSTKEFEEKVLSLYSYMINELKILTKTDD